MALPPERELAGQLAVSRATLREGLAALSQMGLLSIQRGRGGGAVVTAPPPTTVSASIALLFQTRAITAGQLSEFRRALEVEAAQLAAARRSKADLVAIAAALDAYLSCGPDAAAQNVHGRAFHHAVARASGNPLLAETMASINEAFARCFALLHDAPDPAPLIYRLHWPILDAIRRQDAPAARAAMVIHFDQLAQALGALGVAGTPLGSPAAAHGAPATCAMVPRRNNGRAREGGEEVPE
jgi:GntR family transcriptional repressor for pyruvate dehydrogenase complex